MRCDCDTDPTSLSERLGVLRRSQWARAMFGLLMIGATVATNSCLVGCGSNDEGVARGVVTDTADSRHQRSDSASTIPSVEASVSAPQDHASEQVAASMEYPQSEQAFRIALGLRNADRVKIREHARYLQEVSRRVPPGTQMPVPLQPNDELQARYLEARTRFLAAGATEPEVLAIEREMAMAAGL